MAGARTTCMERVYGCRDVFPVMWAIAHLVHVALQGEGTFTDVTEVVVFMAALALTVRPLSSRFLALLALTQLVDWLSVAPFNPDHWTLVAAVNLTLLLVGATSRARRADIVTSAASSLRVLLLIGYGAAAFAKWNSSFLSPGVSCAVWIADQASFGLLDHVPGSGPVAIAFALGSETLVFLLLLIPRARRYGVRLGLIFHALVSLSPAISVSDFTATVFALFVLFLSDTEIDAAVHWLRRVTAGSPVVAILDRYRWIIPTWLFICAGIAGFSSQTLSLLLVWMTFTTYTAITLLSLVRAVSRVGPTPQLRPSTALVPAALFLIFTVLSPYVGLRTTGALTMFSNLRTEGDGSNHLLIDGWHVADYQNELFIITGSSDDALQALADDDQALPITSIRLLPRLVSGTTVDGTVDGSTLSWTAESSTAVIGAPSFFERWFLSFRPVALGGSPRCGN